MKGAQGGIRQVLQYPSAVAGLLIIVALLALSAYTVFTMPLSEAVRLWRASEATWIENPRNARPRWVNALPGVNLPETIILRSRTNPAVKTVQATSDEMTEVTLTFAFSYPYDDFPQEVTVFLEPTFEERRPSVSMVWVRPDGQEWYLGDRTLRGPEAYRLSQDARLQRRLGGRLPEVALFADNPSAERPVPAKGSYRLVINGLLFGERDDLDATLVVYGKVHGLAGTDHRRRDIMVALLWGAPLALAFGFLAAIGSSLSTMVIAAIGAWYGGWIDALIQRVTETSLILPVLPILIMIGTLYSKSIWVMLGVVVLLSIFGAGLKTYRAMFLQIKEAPYIEAARAYGVGDMRIVLRYMLPRVVPVLVPQFVVLIPAYVFLEATLAILGLGDPVLPTWGKVLEDAYLEGALYKGYYYWVLSPSLLLMLTGLGFAMLGFALDRVFNPRLRGM